MLDLAPGWIIRCLTCGTRRPYGETGAIRLGAWSRGKWTVMRCTTCDRFRCAAIEKGTIETSPETSPPTGSKK